VEEDILDLLSQKLEGRIVAAASFYRALRILSKGERLDIIG
jgi:hypothetical protein